jgi:hypothetical protein
MIAAGNGICQRFEGKCRRGKARKDKAVCTARLKPGPDTRLAKMMVFQQPLKPAALKARCGMAESAALRSKYRKGL